MEKCRESQRVLGWAGRCWGILLWLEAGLKGGPGKGRKDGVTGRWGGERGGRRDAACLSLPYPLSLSLFSLHHRHTRSEADTKTQSHSDNRERRSLCFYSFCHRGRMGWLPLPLSFRQPIGSSAELFQQPIAVEAAGALPQPISARA